MKYNVIQNKINAVQFTGKNISQVLNFCGRSAYLDDFNDLWIKNNRTKELVLNNEYIFKDINNEFHTCSEYIFKLLYRITV